MGPPKNHYFGKVHFWEERGDLYVVKGQTQLMLLGSWIVLDFLYIDQRFLIKYSSSSVASKIFHIKWTKYRDFKFPRKLSQIFIFQTKKREQEAYCRAESLSIHKSKTSINNKSSLFRLKIIISIIIFLVSPWKHFDATGLSTT